MDFLPPPTKDNGQLLQKLCNSVRWMSEALIASSNYVIDKVSKKHQEDLVPVIDKLESIEQKLNTTPLPSAISQEYTGTSIDGAMEYISKLEKQIQTSLEHRAKARKFVRDKVGLTIFEEREVAPLLGGDNTLYSLLLSLNTNSGGDERDTSPVVALPPNKD